MKLRLFILIFLVIIIASNDGIALITKSKGSVEYEKNDGTVIKDNLKKGMSLFNEDRIKTGANGFAKYLYLDDGSMIKVHKNASIFKHIKISNFLQDALDQYLKVVLILYLIY